MRDWIFDFLNRRSWTTIILAAAFSGLLIFAQPSYRYFKEWRSGRVLQSSEHLLEEESYQLAFNRAHAAVLLDGSNYEASRHLAELALRFGHPQAHQYWEKVLQNKASTAADWKSAIDASLRIGDYTKAFNYLDRWQQTTDVDQGEFLSRRVQSLALAGRFDLALSTSTEAIKTNPQDVPLKLLHLQLLELSGNSTKQLEFAIVVLDDDTAGFRELVWIANSNAFDAGLRKQALVKALSIEELSIEERLSAVTIAARNDWPEGQDLLEQLKTGIDTSDKTQLANYTSTLCYLGRYDLVGEMLSVDLARSDRVLFRNYLLAQIATGESNSALDLTSDGEDRATSLAEEAFIRALAFKQSGGNSQFQSNLDQAINNAQVDDLAFLESQLLKLNKDEELLKLYAKMSSHRTLGSQARQLWLNLAYRLQNEQQILAALRVDEDWVAQLRDPREKANAAYLNLIYNVNLDSTRRAIEELLATFPSVSQYRALLGLAYLKSGLIAKAQAVFPVTDEILPKLDARSWLIANSVYKSDAMLNDVDSSSDARASRLLPTERELIR